MSGNEKAGNGRGNNRKKPFRRRDNSAFRNEAPNGNGPPNRPPAQERRANSRGHSAGSRWQDDKQGPQNRDDTYKKGGEKPSFPERLKWIPPKANTAPLPAPDCPFCGKPIKDISAAIADKDTGTPVHFDCVTDRIARGENLEKGDVVTYIGGGRFGIVNFNGRSSFRESQDRTFDGNDFKIKKIIEWEDKDKRAEWRSVICEHYSVT